MTTFRVGLCGTLTPTHLPSSFARPSTPSASWSPTDAAACREECPNAANRSTGACQDLSRGRAIAGTRRCLPGVVPSPDARRSRARWNRLRHRARRTGGLYRPQRRRQVDDHQNPCGNPQPHGRDLPGRWPDTVARPSPPRLPDRRRIRPAHPTVVGPAGHRELRPVAGHLPDPAGDLPRQPRPPDRTHGPRAAARRAGAAAIARPAHAFGPGGCVVACSEPSLPRRADYWA